MPSPQTPLNSGFNSKSTALDTLGSCDLSGKVAIVTGGYSGIGLETTKALSQAGATVIVPVRDINKAEKELANIERVEIQQLNLADPESIKEFSNTFLNSKRPLHFLINNAGVMAIPLQRDSRGYELNLSINHLGHFQLTVELWNALIDAKGARVINLSSGAHRRSAFDFDDPNFEHKKYDKWIAYAKSKTATALFAVALDRRGEKHNIRSFSVHPGRIETDLQRHISIEELQALGYRDKNGNIPEEQLSFYKTIAQGAATTIWCAISPMLSGMGGVYCENSDIAPAVPENHKPLDGVLPWAMSEELSEKLWLLSENMTGAYLK